MRLRRFLDILCGMRRAKPWIVEYSRCSSDSTLGCTEYLKEGEEQGQEYREVAEINLCKFRVSATRDRVDGWKREDWRGVCPPCHTTGTYNPSTYSAEQESGTSETRPKPPLYRGKEANNTPTRPREENIIPQGSYQTLAVLPGKKFENQGEPLEPTSSVYDTWCLRIDHLTPRFEGELFPPSASRMSRPSALVARSYCIRLDLDKSRSIHRPM